MSGTFHALRTFYSCTVVQSGADDEVFLFWVFVFNCVLSYFVLFFFLNGGAPDIILLGKFTVINFKAKRS